MNFLLILIIQSTTSGLLAMSRNLLNEELSDKMGVAAKTCKMNMMIQKWKGLNLREEQDMVCFGVQRLMRYEVEAFKCARCSSFIVRAGGFLNCQKKNRFWILFDT